MRHRNTHNVAGVNVIGVSGTVLKREFHSGVVICGGERGMLKGESKGASVRTYRGGHLGSGSLSCSLGGWQP